MGRRLRLEPHLMVDELARRYRAAKEPHDRRWWQILWLLAKGQTTVEVGASTRYSRYWIGQLVRRYNTEGPEAMRNRQYTHSHRAQPLLSPALLAELAEVVRGPAPEGEHWIGRTVAAWISIKLGRPISVYLGWAYLVRLEGKRRSPRPRHVQADPAAQEAFKRKLRSMLRAVATAFPQAQVELWATDEHRIGLEPILHKVWSFDGQRPLAPVQHRYEWRYLVGFIHPASGRTVFHLASTVSIPLFEVELPAFARQVGAGSRKQIVCILGRAGWKPSSVRLRVPDHVHLLFLPAYSPELQPAEHLWALTNTALANRYFASIDDLEDAQAARCVALQDCPDLIRSTTLLHWWPRRIKKRQGSKRM